MARNNFKAGEGWSDSTQNRLLEIAGEIFATSGFENATVAEITKKAAVNVASINYHFGDKLGLYEAVLQHAISADIAPANPSGNVERQFVAFVSEFICSLIGPGRPTWCSRLMTREITQPTPAFGKMIRQVIRPRYSRAREIIGAFLNEPVESERVRLAAHSVIAQCVHWSHARPVFPHIWKELRLDDTQRKRIAEHIAMFSLAGLKAMRRSRRGRAKSRSRK